MKHHLNDALLQRQVQHIVAAAGPEKIYLIGAAELQQEDYSVFRETPVVSSYTHRYFWLVLLTARGESSLQSIQDKIEMLSAAHTPVVAWVMTTFHFARQLESGDFFACRVHATAPLCYDKGDVSFPPSGSTLPAAVLEEHAKAFRRRAGELLAGVELYLLRREHALAALLLHQSAEQLLTAIIYAATGYRPQTHNIERLYQYARFLHEPLATTWPLHTKHCQEQLHHLNKAYIDSRYGHYSIQEAVLQSIAGKLRQLHAAVAA